MPAHLLQESLCEGLGDFRKDGINSGREKKRKRIFKNPPKTQPKMKQKAKNK